MSDNQWPSGAVNETAIRGELARISEPVSVTITRGDIERLDKVITFVNAMAEFFSANFYDDLWNLRNRMVPFEPGDEHHDGEDE